MESIVLYPLLDGGESEGSLICDYVYPYFSNSTHPVNCDDFISISSGMRWQKFAVLEASPCESGVVTPETHITLVRGSAHVPYERINDALECALELQRNIDFLSPKWCAESLANFAGGFRRLVDLLQQPPLYKA
jgi:uncharacterized protein YlzI (FlbEa/FlbD family)